MIRYRWQYTKLEQVSKTIIVGPHSLLHYFGFSVTLSIFVKDNNIQREKTKESRFQEYTDNILWLLFLLLHTNSELRQIVGGFNGYIDA